MGGKEWNTWALGSDDIKRVASRVGKTYVRALNMLLFTLPGTPITYYGEELGVEDIEIGSYNDVVDPVARKFQAKWMELTRDPQRAPLPWGEAKFRNFTKGNTTWLPLPAGKGISIQEQKKEEVSTLNQFKTLAKYHSEASIVAGNFTPILTTKSIISYVRFYPDWPAYMVVMNVGTDEVMENFHTADSEKVRERGRVIVSTTGDKKNDIDMDGVKLMPGEALLVEFPPV